MKRPISITLCLLAACSVVLGQLAAAGADENQEKKTSNAKPDAGGIVIEPSSGKIAEGDTITITFPVGMVSPDLIDVGDQPPPFVSAPKLEGSFLWKSETEGAFTVSGVVAGAHHRLILAPGLKDATGKPFVVKDWSAELVRPIFRFRPRPASGSNCQRGRKFISNQLMPFVSLTRLNTFIFKTATRECVSQSK